MSSALPTSLVCVAVQHRWPAFFRGDEIADNTLVRCKRCRRQMRDVLHAGEAGVHEYAPCRPRLTAIGWVVALALRRWWA